jgi:hypothetical protein
MLQTAIHQREFRNTSRAPAMQGAPAAGKREGGPSDWGSVTTFLLQEDLPWDPREWWQHSDVKSGPYGRRAPWQPPPLPRLPVLRIREGLEPPWKSSGGKIPVRAAGRKIGGRPLGPEGRLLPAAHPPRGEAGEAATSMESGAWERSEEMWSAGGWLQTQRACRQGKGRLKAQRQLLARRAARRREFCEEVQVRPSAFDLNPCRLLIHALDSRPCCLGPVEFFARSRACSPPLPRAACLRARR